MYHAAVNINPFDIAKLVSHYSLLSANVIQRHEQVNIQSSAVCLQVINSNLQEAFELSKEWMVTAKQFRLLASRYKQHKHRTVLCKYNLHFHRILQHWHRYNIAAQCHNSCAA